MGKWELSGQYKKVNRAINQFVMGLYILILSPMVLIALCANRIYEMNVINTLGIGWILVCVLFALPLIILGSSTFIRYIRLDVECKKIVLASGIDQTEWKRRFHSRIVNGVIVGIMLGILSVFPIITVSTLRLSNDEYMAYSYVAIFILAGAGVCFILASLAKLWIQSQVKIIETQVSNELHKVSGKGRLAKRVVRRGAIIIGAIVVIFIVMSRGTWYIQPYIATIPNVPHRELPITYDQETGIYTIQNKADTDFRILQLTDIHLGGSLLSYSKDMRALETVYKLIQSTNPDLVIVTGDYVFPVGIESYSFNNYTPIMQFASFMRNIGVPWASTYGNHDTEFIASHSEDELRSLFQSFSYESTGSLLYPEKEPLITGRSNQVILVNNADGTVNQALYLIDSNSYFSLKLNDYDYIHQDQVDWYANSLQEISAGRDELVSSLIFTHMPLQEFKTAYQLYKEGSSEVTYYFGKIGENKEAICCSEYSSELFNKAVELGSTKGVFVGHDHYNTISMEYKKIRLTYGMSIDYLAMPGISKKTEQRGGTLITLHTDSAIDIEQVPYHK